MEIFYSHLKDGYLALYKNKVYTILRKAALINSISLMDAKTNEIIDFPWREVGSIIPIRSLKTIHIPTIELIEFEDESGTTHKILRGGDLKVESQLDRFQKSLAIPDLDLEVNYMLFRDFMKKTFHEIFKKPL